MKTRTKAQRRKYGRLLKSTVREYRLANIAEAKNILYVVDHIQDKLADECATQFEESIIYGDIYPEGSDQKVAAGKLSALVRELNTPITS